MKRNYLITVYSSQYRQSGPKFQERLDNKGKKFKKGYLKAVERIYSEDNVYCTEI